MAEKVAKLGVTRENDFIYYVADAAVWKVARSRRGVPKGRPEKVAEGNFEMDSDYVYFVDEDGDVSREAEAHKPDNATRRRRKPTSDSHVESNGDESQSHGITHGLQIRKEWLDQILAGTKTWEVRGSTTSRRGPIALIQSKSGLVVGTCDVVEAKGPLSLSELQESASLTGFRPDELYYQNTYAWVLRNARRLSNPISFRHPQGAVIWIKLEVPVIQALNEARAADA